MKLSLNNLRRSPRQPHDSFDILLG